MGTFGRTWYTTDLNPFDMAIVSVSHVAGQWANGFGKSGISDFNALKVGTFLAIETKYGGNKPTAMQKGYLNSIQSEKGIPLVVDEISLSMLAQWLDGFDKAVVHVSRGETVPDEIGSYLMNAVVVLTRPFLTA